MNTYGYVSGNPLSNIDPFGLAQRPNVWGGQTPPYWNTNGLNMPWGNTGYIAEDISNGLYPPGSISYLPSNYFNDLAKRQRDQAKERERKQCERRDQCINDCLLKLFGSAAIDAAASEVVEQYLSKNKYKLILKALPYYQAYGTWNTLRAIPRCYLGCN